MLDVASATDAALALHAGYPYFPEFLREKKELANTAVPLTLEAARNSVRDSVSIFKSDHKDTKLLAKVIVAASNVAFLYGDDIAAYGLYAGIKSSMNAESVYGENVSLALACGALAAAHVIMARKNQKYFPAEPKDEVCALAENKNLRARISKRVSTVKGHLSKCALSLSLGVNISVLQSSMSKREVYAHSVLYGAVSAAIYRGVDIGLEVLDNPVVPAGIVAYILGSRYVEGVWDDALPEDSVMATDDSGETGLPEHPAQNTSLFSR